MCIVFLQTYFPMFYILELTVVKYITLSLQKDTVETLAKLLDFVALSSG